MRMNRYGSYYRGRSRFRTFLKVLIVLLLILLLLAVGVFIAIEQNLVISSDGIYIKWSEPQAEGSPSPTPPATPTVPVVVDTTTPTPEPEPTPTPLPEALHVVQLPRTALYDGTAEAQVSATGGNAALFDMKADDGTLGYISSQELAVSSKVSAADPAINAAIQGLNTGDLYTIARVSCFRDNAVPYRNNTMAIRSSAGNWRDEDGIRWLSPAYPEVRDYITSICVELAQLGFDEILLDFCTYPTNGRLTTIKQGTAYDPSTLSESLDAFYSQVSLALADYPEVKLSLAASEAVLSGSPEDASGQTVGHLAQYAARVWVPSPQDEGSDYRKALEDAGMEAWQLVYRDSFRTDAGESWAVAAVE